MKVACYSLEGKRRTDHIAAAMRDGFVRHGIDAFVTNRYEEVQADLAVAYGWSHEHVFEGYRAKGLHFLYIDLGFWLRKQPGKSLEGYHKISVDGWCPTTKMRRGCPGDRFSVLDVEVKQARSSGDHVLIAGMSGKAALHHGLAPEQWERMAIDEVRANFRQRLVYRPKPSWLGSGKLPGADYSVGSPIGNDLVGCHALVTHHSNAAIDAIAAGVPVYCEKSVGSLLSMPAIADVKDPPMPSDSERLQLLHDVAYLQFTPAEMRSGVVWDNYRGIIA